MRDNMHELEKTKRIGSEGDIVVSTGRFCGNFHQTPWFVTSDHPVVLFAFP